MSSALALFWFLIRVIPKPSRALYPCQRAAFPLASGFVIWLMGGFGSVAAIHKARCSLKKSRYVQWLLLVAVSVGSVWLAVSITTKPNLFADAPAPNSPIGAPKGIHPGRVVWVHDPEATDWDGPGDGHWWESSHTNQSVVSQMMSRAVQSLTGNPNDKAAWESLFKHFNTMHGKGDVGYQPKEKIFIKVNFVGCIQIHSRRPVTETSDYDLKSQDYMNTSPQMIIAILEQLVDRVGVKQSDITVGDPLCYFANEYYQMCKARFPEVQYLDYLGKFGRTAVKQSSVALFWSTPDAAGKKIDHIPESYVQAEYLINLANLKSHNDLAGVTLCAKNHYGSLARKPAGQDDYYDMHKNLPRILPGMGHYRPLVDLMGHKHLGGKTLLYLIDGLYAGKHAKDRAPKKWNSIPFEGDWTSSLLASQDPVAIDSVGFDFLYMEWNDAPHWSGANDYLIEAAMADNPPSGTFYDPDHDGNVVRLRSLGVYEHWNNPIDKQYSRNLGSNKGIELLKLADDITGSQVSVVNRK
ncbi:MAG: DUF362 domain-containing protein [Sedimentisphaerales bacterium]|nr:DUF362 domain-containing protein [Sedimentisphaerales bacterium]